MRVSVNFSAAVDRFVPYRLVHGGRGMEGGNVLHRVKREGELSGRGHVRGRMCPTTRVSSR